MYPVLVMTKPNIYSEKYASSDFICKTVSSSVNINQFYVEYSFAFYNVFVYLLHFDVHLSFYMCMALCISVSQRDLTNKQQIS